MRKTILFILISISTSSNAQTFNEWFKQKETQKKYLLQQIAALKVYLDYAEKGYNIANQGLQTIHSIKKGDFHLHNDFFNSLKQVNPTIKNWSRVADIISIQIKIVKQTKSVLSFLNDGFSSEEIDYCKSVFDNLLTECMKNIDASILLTTSGNYEMKDDERINRIENLYLDMQEKYAFCSSFSDEMKFLAMQRLNEKKGIELSGILNK